MYLGVDVGGSKTKIAAFSEDGQIARELTIPTNPDYPTFLKEINAAYTQNFKQYNFKTGACGAPAEFDRQSGIAKRFGNLDWTNVPLGEDLGKILGLKMITENDANLAGLSEAKLLQAKYRRVVYITLSRGIGGKLIIDDQISKETPGAEVGFMVFNSEGRLTEWEEFASGDALVKRYGKKASELEDPAAWRDYAYKVATGLQPLITIWQPDVVVIGGGAGAHFEKFEKQLNEQLAKFKSRMVSVPPIIKAQRPEEAVIYGCYDFIKQHQ